MVGPISYVGGKNRLARQIIELFPEHTTYVEPFAGGAQVFFHKSPSKVEVLNDLDGDVVNFYRVCQWHPGELARTLELMPASRALHQLHVKTNPATLTDIQRAARFVYLLKNSFGGLIVRQNFHYGVTQPSNYNPGAIRSLIELTQQRLHRVQLEQLPYQDILARYDRPTTLFFLDPPYYGLRLYKHNFADEDYKELADRLSGLKGNFLLSLNDTPEVRRIFSRFVIREVNIVYTARREASRRYRELVISDGQVGKSTTRRMTPTEKTP